MENYLLDISSDSKASSDSSVDCSDRDYMECKGVARNPWQTDSPQAVCASAEKCWSMPRAQQLPYCTRTDLSLEEQTGGKALFVSQSPADLSIVPYEQLSVCHIVDRLLVPSASMVDWTGVNILELPFGEGCNIQVRHSSSKSGLGVKAHENLVGLGTTWDHSISCPQGRVNLESSTAGVLVVDLSSFGPISVLSEEGLLVMADLGKKARHSYKGETFGIYHSKELVYANGGSTDPILMLDFRDIGSDVTPYSEFSVSSLGCHSLSEEESTWEICEALGLHFDCSKQKLLETFRALDEEDRSMLGS